MARVGVLEGAREDHEERIRIVERDRLTPEEKRELNQRVRALEVVMWKWAGGLAVIVAVSTMLGTLLAKHLGG